MPTWDLVVAKYNEDISWISQVPMDIKVIVYNKAEFDSVNRPPFLKLRNKVIYTRPYDDKKEIYRDNVEYHSLPNVGREGDTYLHHIITNYHKLADYTIFSQGDPFPHSPDLLKLMDPYIRQKYQDVQPMSDRYLTNIDLPPAEILKPCTALDNLMVQTYPCSSISMDTILYHDPGAPNIGRRVKEIFRLRPHINLIEDLMQRVNMKNPHKSHIFTYCYSGQFAVKKEKILMHDIECYKALKEINLTDPIFGFLLERAWMSIFGFDEWSNRP